MTNHSYFNLDGHDAETVLKEKITIDADYFTEADEKSIPTGELLSVAGTPMDFRVAKEVGAEIEADYEALKLAHGYDHNYVLKNNGQFCKVATATADRSGIRMEVFTDLPGLQLYTANYLNHVKGKLGAVYDARSAVCFETQYFPDAPHHKNFPDTVLKKGEIYDKTTVYRFSVS
jgi:aldose 1-epimerase